jgi:hypothetical protein
VPISTTMHAGNANIDTCALPASKLCSKPHTQYPLSPHALHAHHPLHALASLHTDKLHALGGQAITDCLASHTPCLSPTLPTSGSAVHPRARAAPISASSRPRPFHNHGYPSHTAPAHPYVHAACSRTAHC